MIVVSRFRLRARLVPAGTRRAGHFEIIVDQSPFRINGWRTLPSLKVESDKGPQTADLGHDKLLKSYPYVTLFQQDKVGDSIA
jgi:hypothetical protein